MRLKGTRAEEMARVDGWGSLCPRPAFWGVCRSWKCSGAVAGASRAQEANGGDLPAVTEPEVPWTAADQALNPVAA